SRWKAGLAFLPIALYSGKRGFVRGRVWQYVFYVFYPGHLLLLYWISRQLFG
ncbi:MAG: TraX protein, partial [Clostridia bacterium]|nr:TraX protein [Clostridia bacterium]